MLLIMQNIHAAQNKSIFSAVNTIKSEMEIVTRQMNEIYKSTWANAAESPIEMSKS